MQRLQKLKKLKKAVVGGIFLPAGDSKSHYAIWIALQHPKKSSGNQKLIEIPSCFGNLKHLEAIIKATSAYPQHWWPRSQAQYIFVIQLGRIATSSCSFQQKFIDILVISRQISALLRSNHSSQSLRSLYSRRRRCSPAVQGHAGQSRQFIELLRSTAVCNLCVLNDVSWPITYGL